MRWPFRKRRESAVPPEVTAPTPPVEPASLEGWWFAPAGTAPHRGRHDVETVLPTPGQQGLHAARTVLDALEFARSPHLCRVRLSGEIAERGPLIAAKERTILWCLDPTPLLRSILIELAREVLAADVPAETSALATRALAPAELSSLSAVCDTAREALLDAESRVSDVEWRLERKGGDAAIAEARVARTTAAHAKARLHALDALRVASGKLPSDLGSALDLALRAIAWTRAASGDAITSIELDRATAAVRAEWALTLDDRLRTIAAATRVDASPAIAPPPVSAEPAPTKPRPRPRVSIEPLSMALPRVAAPPPGPSLEEMLARSWPRAVTSTLEADAAVTRAATIDLDARGQRAIVATLEPFDYAARVMAALLALEREGVAPLVVLLGGRSLDRSGPDVWATRALLTLLEGAPPELLGDEIARALEQPDLLDRSALPLARTHGVELDPATVVVDPFERATHRCAACGVRYELPHDVALENGRCRCGSRELVTLELRRAPPSDGPALCMMCGLAFEPRGKTRHVCCPGCGCIGAPVPYPFLDQIERLRIGTEAQQADRALARFSGRAQGANRSAWLSRERLELVIEAATPVDRDALHLALGRIHGVSAVVVMQGSESLVPLRATGALLPRADAPELRVEIAEAWRTSTVWSLPGLDHSACEGAHVRVFRSRCDRCRRVAVVTLPPATPVCVCAGCGEEVAPELDRLAPLRAPQRFECHECHAPSLRWTSLPHVVCPTCRLLQPTH